MHMPSHGLAETNCSYSVFSNSAKSNVGVVVATSMFSRFPHSDAHNRVAFVQIKRAKEEVVAILKSIVPGMQHY